MSEIYLQLTGLSTYPNTRLRLTRYERGAPSETLVDAPWDRGMSLLANAQHMDSRIIAIGQLGPRGYLCTLQANVYETLIAEAKRKRCEYSAELPELALKALRDLSDLTLLALAIEAGAPLEVVDKSTLLGASGAVTWIIRKRPFIAIVVHIFRAEDPRIVLRIDAVSTSAASTLTREKIAALFAEVEERLSD